VCNRIAGAGGILLVQVCEIGRAHQAVVADLVRREMVNISTR